MDREKLIVPIEWKAAAGADHGELDGYASVFNNVDLDGDVVLPGAFRKTLADWANAKAPLPLTADHELSTAGVIGSIVQAAEDNYGLKIKARFSSVPKAQDIRTKMIEGHLRGLSFIYEPLNHYKGQKNGQQVRFLRELRLYEMTVSPAPRNLLALGSAKASAAPSAAPPAGLDLDGFTDAMRKALDIPFAPARKAAVLEILAAYQPSNDSQAAGPADGPPTADAAATTPPGPAGTASDAAQGTSTRPAPPLTPREYADQIMQQHGPADGSPASLDALEAEIRKALGGQP